MLGMQLGGLQERDPVLCSRSDEVAVWAVPSSGPGAEGALGAVAVLLTPQAHRWGCSCPSCPLPMKLETPGLFFHGHPWKLI